MSPVSVSKFHSHVGERFCRTESIGILFLAVLVTLFATSEASAQRYGWTVSASSTDPMVTTGDATFGVTNLYLWLECCDSEGLAAAEFDLEATGIQVLASSPQNGFLNAGGASNLLLAVGGCPCGPVVAASLLVLDSPGSLCLASSGVSGTFAVVNCERNPEAFVPEWIGFSSDGSSCSSGSLCRSENMRDSSWSMVKGIYGQR